MAMPKSETIMYIDRGGVIDSDDSREFTYGFNATINSGDQVDTDCLGNGESCRSIETLLVAIGGWPDDLECPRPSKIAFLFWTT